MKIELGKQYRTRDGHEVRIYATDGGAREPVHGAILFPLGWEHHCWGKDGTKWLEKTPLHDLDLIEVKPRIQQTIWTNLYPDNHFTTWASKEIADKHAVEHRLACVKVEIDCEEGEGL